MHMLYPHSSLPARFYEYGTTYMSTRQEEVGGGTSRSQPRERDAMTGWGPKYVSWSAW